MKKLLLSLTMLSIFSACEARSWESERKQSNVFYHYKTLNNDGNDLPKNVGKGDEIKKNIEKYGKDSLEKKYKDYRVIATTIVDTTLVKEYVKQDSIIISNFIVNEAYAMSVPMYRVGMKQNILMRKNIAPKTIDYNIAKMYDKPNLKMENIMKELISNSKKTKLNEKTNKIIHIFDYKDSNGGTICDTAMFIYTPIKFRLFSNATKFDKGINFTGTVKTFKKEVKESISKMRNLPSE